MSVIDELFNSEIMRVMNVTAVDKEYSDILSELSRLEAELVRRCPDCKELLDEYQNVEGKATSIAQKYEFARGFRIGALVILEMTKPNL